MLTNQAPSLSPQPPIGEEIMCGSILLERSRRTCVESSLPSQVQVFVIPILTTLAVFTKTLWKGKWARFHDGTNLINRV